MTYLDAQGFSLTYLDRFDIENEAEGLHEPSGLVLAHGNDALWTVCDESRKIFKLGLDGDLKKRRCFEIEDKGLEGIALDPTGEFLFTVKEDGNEIIQIRLDTQETVARQRLATMEGYHGVEHYFVGGRANKGLEGITWNRATGTLFVIKERAPGLLIALSPDLTTIRSHQMLNEENGFRDNELAAERLDFSDICYDQSRNQFWIVSDEAKRLFLYDWNANKVTHSARLGYGKGGKYREIEKAEGVTVDPEANRLYVVSDKEARLYVFDVRE